MHLVLDNEVHESTGSQATVSRHVSFAAVAKACGYAKVYSLDDPARLEEVFRSSPPGPVLIHFRIKAGALPGLGRPKITPEQVKNRLMDHLAKRKPRT